MGGVGRDWGCEKKRRGGGAGACCPALAVAPAAGAPPVVPDPWALPKRQGRYPPVPRVTCTVEAPGWRALCNKKTDPLQK